MIIKKADRLILKGFIGPYVVSFFIVEFVLVMQFMWKWIDDLLGRGFAMIDYLELIGLFGVTIIPLSLPLTILLSSVMVYGDMAEHYELSSLKSAGLSLLRIFRPALILALATAGLSIASSNYFKPEASKAFLRKFNNMKLSKVTFALEEKVFNLDFHNHTIYADKKSKDGKSLEQVMIYHTDQKNKSLLNVIAAEKAYMRVSDNGKYMIMDLYDGRQYQETPFPDSKANYINKPDRSLPVNQATFKKYRLVFELSDIFKDMSNMSLERKKFDMLNTLELLDHVDSINHNMVNRKTENVYSFGGIVPIQTDTITTESQKSPIERAPDQNAKQTRYSKKMQRSLAQMDTSAISIINTVLRNKDNIVHGNHTILEFLPQVAQQKIIDGAKAKNSSLRTRTWNNYVQFRSLDRNRHKYLLRLNQQYCWAFVCVLMLFIGGPMGAIVRKGGFGAPLLVAIGFYMLFVILKILGERLAHSGELSGAAAAWLPFLVLFPFAALVTYFALKDIRVSLSSLKSFFTTMNLPFKKRIAYSSLSSSRSD